MIGPMRPSFALGALILSGCAAGVATKPVATVVQLGPSDRPYVELLRGPPQSVSMESGAVSLAPHASVGEHDTEDYEELLVPLEGRGELRARSQAPLALSPGLVAYTPPHTRHDVVNTGDVVFRYVYVAARTR